MMGPCSLLLFKIAFILGLIHAGFVPMLVWSDRKLSAFMQDRVGPSRASILGIRAAGLLHALADVIKLITKEDITPSQARPFYYNLALFFVMLPAFIVFIVVPFGDHLTLAGHDIALQVSPLNSGILFVFAMSSMSVLGVILAGWASGSSYPLLGGLRAAAQMVSYEVTLGLSIVGALMIYGTLRLERIVHLQSGELWGVLPHWGVFLQPLGFVLFMIALFAETNRNPFDMPEGEQEIVGYHAEYSSMRFAMFFMSEYAHIAAGSAVAVTLFLGGWQVPYMDRARLIASMDALLPGSFALAGACMLLFIAVAVQRYRRVSSRIYRDARRYEPIFWALLWSLCLAAFAAAAGYLAAHPLSGAQKAQAAALMQVGIFLVKTALVCFSFIWVRWTLPRFRYDQLMRLGWKRLLPLALVNILLTGGWLLCV